MTDPRIEPAARALFLAHPLSNKEVVDACWDLYENEARAALAAADNAATITTVEGLDALPVGAVVLGWAFDGQTPYLRCISARGRLVWGCVGQAVPLDSADLLKGGFKARVIHWGTE